MRGASGLLLSTLGLAVALPVAAQNAAPPPQGTVEQRLQRVERQARRITELVLQVEALKRENRELRGRIDEQNYAIEAMKRKQRDLYLDIDQRLSRAGTAPVVPVPGVAAPGSVSGAAPGSAPGVSSDPATATGAPVTGATAAPVAAAAPVAGAGATPPLPTGDPAEEERAYQAAKDMLLKEPRRFKEAKIAFREFLIRYPTSVRAPRAQYWLAEASYVVGDNQTALTDYQQIIDRWPDSDMVPGALLKIGFIQHAEGRHEAARAALERVITEHPDSLPAPKARERLDRIAKEGR